MSVKSIITDGSGTGNEAKVTSRGQLVTAPLAYSEAYFNVMDVINTAYNFIEPQTGKRFVITGIIINGNKNVGPDGSLVEIYEANSISSTVVQKPILTVQVQKNGAIPLTSLNIITSNAVWINAKNDDDDVYISILGYYVKA